MLRLADTTVRDLMAALHLSDEQTDGNPVLSPDLVDTARTYLEQLLLDAGDRFPQHIAALERRYGAHFAPPLPRCWRDGMDLPAPKPPAEFPHSAVLEESLAQAVLEGGVDRLPESDLGKLLLNPLALWDLMDRINSVFSDYWLRRMEEVGVPLAREIGIDLYADFETVVGAKRPEGHPG
jgi:hypothetical protein